jgi:hypothetical protein
LSKRFLVDRESFVPNTTKEIPDFISTSLTYRRNTLKGYITRFNDIKEHHIKAKDPKVLVHLLPRYQPLSDDFVTLRHTLYMLYERVEKGDVYYFILLHKPDEQPRRALPLSFDRYNNLPSMPYRLDSLLVMPQTTDFVDTDRQQLTALLSDLLGAVSHRRKEDWNGHVGDFKSRFIRRQRKCGYIEFPWHDGVESAVIAAECVSYGL